MSSKARQAAEFVAFHLSILLVFLVSDRLGPLVLVGIELAMCLLWYYFVPRLRSYVLLLPAVSLAAFFAIELAFRLTYFGVDGLSIARYKPCHVTSPVADVPYDPHSFTGIPAGRYYSRGAPITYNQDGFRGAAVAREKPTGVFRIVAVGGSMTEGEGVDDAAAWTRRLEDELNRTRPGGYRFEVMNLGVGAATFGNMLYVVENYALAFRPDLVLVEDVLPNWRITGLAHRPTFSLDVVAQRKSPYALSSSFERWLDPAYRVFSQTFFFAAAIETYFVREELGETRRIPDFDRFRETMNLFRVAAGGVPISVVSLSAHSDWAGNLRPEYRAAIEGYCRTMTLDCVLGAYDRSFGPRPLLYPGDFHPNAVAHEIYSDEIYRAVAGRFTERSAPGKRD